MEEILNFKKINSDILPELREFSNALTPSFSSFSLREKEGFDKEKKKKKEGRGNKYKKKITITLPRSSLSFSRSEKEEKEEHEKENITLLLNKVCEKNLKETILILKKCDTENLFAEVQKRLNKSTAIILAQLCCDFYEKSVLLNMTQNLFEENEKTEGIIIFLKTLYEENIISNRIFKYCAGQMLKIDIDLFLILTPSFFKNKGPEQTELRKKIKELEGISLRHKFLLEEI